MKHLQPSKDEPSKEDIKLNSLDGFKLFYEELPLRSAKTNTSGRLQRPSRTNSR